MASTIYYNPTAAVAWLNQQQQLQPFLETWGQVCISSNELNCCMCLGCVTADIHLLCQTVSCLSSSTVVLTRVNNIRARLAAELQGFPDE